MLNFSDSECTRTLLHALQISSFSSQYLLTFALDWQRSEMRSNTDVDRRTFGRRHEREHCASAFTVIRLRLASAPAYLAAAWDWCNAAFKRCAAEGVAEAKGLQMACLRGALVDLVDLRVAHQLLNRVSGARTFVRGWERDTTREDRDEYASREANAHDLEENMMHGMEREWSPTPMEAASEESSSLLASLTNYV